MTDPIRIANCSGFYGDRLSGAREMVEDGPIDVLTGDWLAELTMLILARSRASRPRGGCPPGCWWRFPSASPCTCSPSTPSTSRCSSPRRSV